MMKNTLIPVFLKTEELHFLVIGGGTPALEITRMLLAQNREARLTVIASEIREELELLVSSHAHTVLVCRRFNENDLVHAHAVLIATGHAEQNREIAYTLHGKKLLFYTAGYPALSNFYPGFAVEEHHGRTGISGCDTFTGAARICTEDPEGNIPGNIAGKAQAGKIQTVLRTNTAACVRNISILFCVFFTGYGFSSLLPVDSLGEFAALIPDAFYYMLLTGFLAQLVDGALGLGYGMTAATAMMAMGIKLPAISGSIHTAEMFSSALSGYSHYKFGNVNKKMLYWLAVPGVAGAVLGSLFVIYIGGAYEYFAYPFVALYLIIIALRLISLAFKHKINRKPVKHLSILGFSGGFLDAFGGGGWGPIVTSTLLTKGRQGRYVVGTVSLAEFFVTFAATLTFFTSLGVDYWYIVLGLITGGMLAAPVAAKLAGKIPQKISYILVGLLVIAAGIRIIITMMI